MEDAAVSDQFENGNEDDDDAPHRRAFLGIRPARDLGNLVRIRSSMMEANTGVLLLFLVLMLVDSEDA